MVWKPNVTVAAVVEKEGRFLMVEEDVGGERVINQPAGHLEQGETLIQAVARETLEETGWHFAPNALLGVYRWRHPGNDTTFLRFAFCGDLREHDPSRELDNGIIRALWLTPAQLRQEPWRHRSPQVLRCVDDFLAGTRYPLDILKEVAATN